MKVFNLLATLAVCLLLSLSAAQEPLKIGVSDWPGWVAWYVAEEQGYFETYGVDVELVWFPVYTDSISALSAGQLDANSQTWGDTLAPVAQGIDLKVVLINDNSAGNDAILATPDITDLASLEGKKVGLELFTVSHLLFIHAMQEAGLEPDSVELVNLTAGDAAAAFMAGNLDGATVWNPWIVDIQESGEGTALFTSADAPGLIPDALVAKSESLETRREDFKNVLRAWFDAVAFIQEDPAAAADIMAAKVELDPETYARFLEGTRFFTLEDNLEAFSEGDDMTSLYTSGAFIQDVLASNDLMPAEFEVGTALDGSLVEELAAE